MNKIGTLKIVASTGGLKLFGSDDWLNPIQKVTSDGLEHLNSLKEKKVIIDFNDKGKYISCVLYNFDTEKTAEPSSEQKTSLQAPNTQTSIVRQSSLKAAVELIKSASTTGYSEMMLLKETIKMAEDFENWVNRKC